MPNNSAIILTTLNARYMHTAFALRYLYANLGDLQSQTTIVEFTIQQLPINVVEAILANKPKMVCFSIYIWNVSEISKTVALLKQVAPELVVVLGGPEVSHWPDVPPVAELADYVIAGPGEISLPVLCRDVLSGELPGEKFIQGKMAALEQLELPYAYYTDEDIRNRLIYVEASRGCPFKCEFCLSSLDKTAVAFELDRFLTAMDALLVRGVRNFKFIDRTFNLKISSSIRILEFFLARMSDDLYLHFEVVPDHLPDRLKAVLERFPKKSLQFEIGVQTFDQEIQHLISRKQNNDKSKANIVWLKENTGAHLHTDLIFGLPGDSLDNFAHSFDQLVALKPHEIQLGILKRLRGAPLNRHNSSYHIHYNPEAPYNVLTTKDIDFATMQRVNRFARYWDMIANSGRFPQMLGLVLADHPFADFMRLSDSLYQHSGSTWKIALKRLFELIYQILIEDFDFPSDTVERTLGLDFSRAGLKGAIVPAQNSVRSRTAKNGAPNKRQLMHLD